MISFRKGRKPEKSIMSKKQIKKEILDLVKKLISYQTTDDHPEKQILCADEIEKKFKKDLVIKRYFLRKRPVIVLSNTNKKTVDIIISGHIDVVPGDKEQFVPKIKGGRLYGRGTYDMKASVVASVFALRDYVKIGQKKKVNVAILLTSDEELDGYSTDKLLSEKGYKAKFAVILDGGSETDIVLRQKGIVQLKVSVPGKSAHSSRPWDGDDPIGKSSALHKHLLSKFSPPNKKDQWKTSIALTKIVTDNSVNQIPESALAFFDIRYVNKLHMAEIIKEMKKYLGRGAMIEIVAENGIFSVDQDNPYVKILVKSIQDANRKKVCFVNENGTSDAIFFTENDIPAALFRPKGGSLHQNNEWVDVDSVHRSYQSLCNFLANLSS